MDETDAVPRPRRQRPKDSFQNELQSKLRQRKNLGLSAEISDTDEDDDKFQVGRSGSTRKYQDGSATLHGGLGTTTMSSRNLTQLLGSTTRGRYDDEDEELAAVNYGRGGTDGRRWQSSGLKTPSPTQDGLRSARSPSYGSPKDPSGKLDAIFGRKTPTRESPTSSKSPQLGLSRDDKSYGRKTPTSDNRKSPAEGSRLPGMGSSGDKWQPPNFRSASPSSSVEHSRGSRGVTPIDSALGTISETPREGSSRMKFGQGLETSPRQTSYSQAPKPQARNLRDDNKTPPLGGDRKTPTISGERKTRPTAAERKTPPLGDSSRRSPLLRGDAERKTPTLDVFGKSRSDAAQDLGSYMAGFEKEKQAGLAKDMKQERLLGYSRGDKTRAGATGKDFPVIGSKRESMRSPASKQISNRNASPLGRKTPTNLRDASPTSSSQRAKTPPAQDKRASLLDFLMEDGSADKPKPKERGRRGDGDMFDAQKSQPSLRNKFSGDHKVMRRRKSQEMDGGDTGILGQPEEMFKTAPIQQQRAEDTSSICEDIPPDPTRKMRLEEQKAAKQGKQTTDRMKADAAINMISEAQTMTYIEPAKKMRPFTASAKVQHRPKPRYDTLPGQNQTLKERQFNSTGDIRDAIYEEWYRERIKSARRKKKEEEEKAKKEEEEEKRKKEEKRLEAEASYRAWMNKKKEVILTEKEKKHAEEMKKKEKERQEAEEKRVESIKSFQHWKQEKDSMIKRELYKKIKKKEQEEEDKKYEEERKQKDRQTAYNGWKAKKEKVVSQRIAEKKYMQKTQKQREEEEKEELRMKEEEALERYERWLENKERQAKREKRRTKQRREDDFRPAFRPASATIPFGR